MTVYVIVMHSRLSDSSYILKEGYTDESKARKKCSDLNHKSFNSKDPYIKDEYYTYTVVNVEVSDGN